MCRQCPLGWVCGVPPGTAEAVYLLASSADGNWLAAVSGDWEIHVYSLKHFKVGEGAAVLSALPQGAGCTAPLGQEGEVPRGTGGCLRGRDCPRVPPALSPPVSAPLHGAHVQLCGDSPRHPPRHQQPRHRLRGPAGRGCPQQGAVPTQHSAWLMPGGCGAAPNPLSCPAALRVQHPREAVHGLEPHGAELGAAQGLAGEGLAHHPHRLQPPEPRAHPAARRLHVLRPRQVPGERGWGLPGGCSRCAVPVEQGKGRGTAGGQDLHPGP